MEQTYLDLIKLMGFTIAIIIGFVEFLKSALGWKGKKVTMLSFGVGAGFGILTFAAYLFPEAALYIAGFIFIIASGLSASGYYKFINARFPRKDDPQG